MHVSEIGLRGRRVRTGGLPSYGRFLQADPIGYEESPNLYAYVGNDPVNFVDPLGLEDVVVTGTRCSGAWVGSDASGWACVNLDLNPTLGMNRGPDIVVTGNRLASLESGIAQNVSEMVDDVVNDVTCAIGTAADAVSFSLDTAGDAIETSLDAVHDVVFPPACAAPCVTAGQARVALSNDEFRRWFHRTYKQQQNISGGGRHNPDMDPEEVMDAYDEWQQLQKQFKPRC